MSLILEGLQFCKEVSETEGDLTPGSPTASLTLDGPPNGFESIIVKVGNGNEAYFFLRHNYAWMRFRGTVTNPDQVSVDEVVESSDNGNPLVLGPGTKYIYCAVDEYSMGGRSGTWTPAVGGTATYDAQVGHWVKLGRQVTVWGRLYIATIGTGSASIISGVPFPAYESAVGAVHFQSGALSLVSAIAFLGAGQSAVWLMGASGASASLTLQDLLGDGIQVTFTITYLTEA